MSCTTYAEIQIKQHLHQEKLKNLVEKAFLSFLAKILQKNLSEGNPDIDKEAVRELGPGIE